MKLHLMCGIPGSGKSTLARQIPGYLVSTDSIRKFLWQDESVVKHDKLVFNLAESIVDYVLGRCWDAVLDATNLTVAKRTRFINLAVKHGARVMLHWVKCPLETAIERNFCRDRQVPVEIIKSLYKSFQMPTNDEGLNVIRIYDPFLRTEKIIMPGRILIRGKRKLLKK